MRQRGHRVCCYRGSSGCIGRFSSMPPRTTKNYDRHIISLAQQAGSGCTAVIFCLRGCFALLSPCCLWSRRSAGQHGPRRCVLGTAASVRFGKSLARVPPLFFFFFVNVISASPAQTGIYENQTELPVLLVVQRAE